MYAFGIVLWEVFTRKEVHEGLSAAQIIAKVANEGLRPMVCYVLVAICCEVYMLFVLRIVHIDSSAFAMCSSHGELLEAGNGDVVDDDDG